MITDVCAEGWPWCLSRRFEFSVTLHPPAPLSPNFLTP